MSVPLPAPLSRPAGRALAAALSGSLCATLPTLSARAAGSLTVGQAQASITLLHDAETRTYLLSTTAELRGPESVSKQITFSELPGHASIRTGDVLFDGLYAMAVAEARANSVSEISDGAYANGAPIRIDAFQTGESWKYVWTRDLSYSLHLALANFDPKRAMNSLLFKASEPKPSVSRGTGAEMVQDTGSGGSYPVSSDRVVWTLGAHETLLQLAPAERQDVLARVYPILCGTIEQDRKLVFDPDDGLYRGEQSFLDWREQTYPGWTKTNVLSIAVSKALSVNAGNYILLTRAAEYSRLLGKTEEAARYAQWAGELRDAVNRRFFDPQTGLYSTYLLSDDGVSDSVRTKRYDLLGESLAVLSGLADAKQASSIIARYPTGPFGPPVVWPQERTVPIYHNQAIWPFVTAYWIKAARQAGNDAAVEAGIQSLEQLAALNLSNMENFDFVSGRAQVKTGPRVGPEINSRRQLWSVAGYLSMVQDVVFGMETSWEGIRFQPYVTAKLRNGIFAASAMLDWRGLIFHGTEHHVKVHLPPARSIPPGVCTVERVELNGKAVGTDFVKSGELLPKNEWDVFLAAPAVTDSAPATLRTADVADERAIFGPVQPRWKSAGQGGITVENDRLVLHYEQDDLANVTFSIYRDGQLRAEGIRETTWTDPDSGDYRDTVRAYRVGAVDAHSGNASHLTPAHAYRAPDQERVIPAKSLHNRGGNLAGNNHHFENWGKPDHELASAPVTVGQRGRFIVRAEFSNGAGPVNTGITCAIKKLEICKAASGESVAAGYLIMPQSGDWTRYDLSSAVKAELNAGEEYILRLSEDEYCRNMSYMKSNERYTSAAGGGESCYNYVNIAALHLLYVSAQ